MTGINFLKIKNTKKKFVDTMTVMITTVVVASGMMIASPSLADASYCDIPYPVPGSRYKLSGGTRQGCFVAFKHIYSNYSGYWFNFRLQETLDQGSDVGCMQLATSPAGWNQWTERISDCNSADFHYSAGSFYVKGSPNTWHIDIRIRFRSNGLGGTIQSEDIYTNSSSQWKLVCCA